MKTRTAPWDYQKNNAQSNQQLDASIAKLDAALDLSTKEKFAPYPEHEQMYQKYLEYHQDNSWRMSINLVLDEFNIPGRRY